MDVDSAFVHIDIVAPDTIKQLRSGENAGGRRHEEFQQTEFGWSQPHFAGLAVNAVGFPVQLNIVNKSKRYRMATDMTTRAD